jgi:hypothetical protein
MRDESRSPGEQDVRAGAWVRLKRRIKGDKLAGVLKMIDGDILVLMGGKMTRARKTDAELVPVRV